MNNDDPITALQALRADVEILRIAVACEDHAGAEQIISGHDQRVRAFVQAHGVVDHAAELRELICLQKALMADMLALRDEASAKLRAGRQSVRAAHAYQMAGTL